MEQMRNARQLRRNIFAAKVAQYVLLILNFIALISSIGAVGVGMSAVWEHRPLEYLLHSNLYSSSGFLLIAIGSMIFVLIAVGCFAAITQFKCLLVIYGVCMMTVALMAFVTGAMGAILRAQVTPSFINRLELTLLNTYGHPDEPHVTEGWDYLQSSFGCCALMEKEGLNYKLWSKSSWFNRQTAYPRQRVPKSCCPSCYTIRHRYCNSDFQNPNGSLHYRICTAATVMCSYDSHEYANLDMCQGIGGLAIPRDWPVEAYTNTEGCFAHFEKAIKHYASVISIAAFGLMAILTAAIVCTFLLYRINERHRGYAQAGH